MNAAAPADLNQAVKRRTPLVDYVGEAIDQLITIETKNPGLPHNNLRPMYAAARALCGGRPISTVCAERLVSSLAPGNTVLFLTGAGYPPHMPQGEDDGPPGAASLARALYTGLGIVPVYVCEPCHLKPIFASSHAAGLLIKDEFRHARDLRLGAAMAVSPSEQSAVPDWVQRIFEELKPKAVIAAERLGPAADGVLYNLTAQPYGGASTTTEYDVVDISALVTEANSRGILTIGVGDHGNEIGFGKIPDVVADAMPRGSQLCTIVETEILLPAMMSNWGYYGIEAALAFLLRRSELMHSPAQEERIIRACQTAGGIDAIYGSTDFAVDGLDGETSMACVQILGNIVRKSLERVSTGPAH